MAGEPFPKSKQLARGLRRYRRKVASPKQWQAIQSAKIGPCRVCLDPATNGRVYGRIALHHVIPRDLGGDDVADNIVPLCQLCHHAVTVFRPAESHKLCASLTDEEYAYAIERGGEDVFERVYGIEYQRP